MSAEIRAEGLRQFRNDLRQAGSHFPKEMQRANKRVAFDLIVPAAKQRAASRPHPRPGSKLIGTIRATATQTSAAVNMGGARTPWNFGQEWGSDRFAQFPSKNRSGYILYPTVKERREEIHEAYVDVLDDLSAQAFPKGRL